jgi:uncharacterized protein (TIGR02594 family)
MNPVDIVARLQLRAEQFSSDTGRAFADLKTKAASAADDVRSSFSSSFAEVQRLASNALTFKRTEGGSLDLSSEISQLRSRATLIEQNAQAARELSIAMQAAASAAGTDAEALRREADAAAVSALAGERDAQALRDRAEALEVVQRELNQSISATDRQTAATAHSAVSAGQHRQAMMSLGQQFGDFTVQVVSGQSAVIAFAQQFPQAMYAVQSMGGELGALGAFMSSGWGTAITIALVALTPFIGALLDTSKAAEEAKKTEQAFAEFQQDLANYIDLANGKLRDRMDLYARLKVVEDEKTIRDKEALVTDYAQQAFARARAGAATGQTYNNDPRVPQTTYDQQLLDIINKANGNPAQLAKDLEALSRTRPEIKGMVEDVAKLVDMAAQARREADKLRGSTYDLNTALRGGTVVTTDMIDRQVALKNATTDVERAQAKYNIVKAQEAEINRMNPGPDKDKALAKYRADLDAATAAVKRAQQAAKDAKKDMENVTGSGALLRSAETYKGANEGTPKGQAQLKALFSAAGMGNINVSPDMIAWCAAFVNAVLATNGLKGTGSMAARSFLNYGTETNSPQKGDIVVLSRGPDPTKGHVGFFEGFDKNGNVRVLGGNQGKAGQGAVSEATFSRSAVLGYRRAPASPQDEDTQAAKREAQLAREQAKLQAVQDTILRINEAWSDSPTLVKRATIETNKLNEIIAEYQDKQDDASKKIVADAMAAKDAIADGLNKPFNDFVRAQKESLALQNLSLQGRDVEAAALRDILQIQRAQGQVSDAQIKQALQYEAAQKRIADALEDQQRLVSIASDYVGNMQRDFDKFLKDLDDGNRGAIGDLFKGWLEDFKQLRRDLISNAVFGGVDRDISAYIRKLTGKQTPAEILAQQASDSGKVMKSAFEDVGNAANDLTAAFRDAMKNITGSSGFPVGFVGGPDGIARLPSRSELLDLWPDVPNPIAPANDNTSASDDIVVTAFRESIDKQAKSADKMLDAGDIFHRASGDMLGNIEKLTGVAIPQAIKDALPNVLQGASIFSSIGAQFGGQGGNIGAGIGASLGALLKPDSPLMKQLGPYAAAYQLGQAISQPIGKALGFNPTAVAVGGLPLGGILKLFGIGAPQHKGSAGIGLDQFGQLGSVGATGTSSQRSQGAASMADAVAQQLQQIANQLGAKITGTSDVRIGTYENHIRVNDHGGAIGGVKGSGAISFDTQEEAVAYAVQAALQDGILSGISAASLKILKSGQDISTAITKALAIESIPHDLKAMLDPLGSAVDDFNKKWQTTVDALNEGGATAEQMAQAQQLYNAQLEQIKANTPAASQALKDFLNSLKVGSDSPYSLRDQEATALSTLKPYLDAIAAGKTIDQSKYQDAASQYLDIERQIYGSTQTYFEAMDMIQAATNKAIAAIDNAVPVTPGVPDPFTKATADATQTVATNTQTQNEMTEQTNELLRQLLDKIVGNNDAAAFVNDPRGFLLGKAA